MSEALQPLGNREIFEQELDTLDLSEEARRKLLEADDGLVDEILECGDQLSFLRRYSSLTSAQFQEYQHVMEFYRARVSRINGVRR